ncbi:hypothetical protein B0H14DRAFT_2633455 [Mycena olivaceomarginata]|nr:hypothetical protein B0H14DRAFT_2633455 [Mycena olivaceomarginata]
MAPESRNWVPLYPGRAKIGQEKKYRRITFRTAEDSARHLAIELEPYKIRTPLTYTGPSNFHSVYYIVCTRDFHSPASLARMGSPMDVTYGAMLIGVLFATFFQGVLTVQAYIYYESFPDDLRRVKSLASSSPHLVPTTLRFGPTGRYRMVAGCHPPRPHFTIVLSLSGDELGEWSSPARGDTFAGPTPNLRRNGDPPMSRIFPSSVRIQIWMFSRHNWMLTGILTAACLATFAMGILLSAQILQVPSVAYFSVHTAEVVALFALGGVGLATRYRISELDRHASKPSHSVLAIGCLVAYLAAPHTFIFIVNSINNACHMVQADVRFQGMHFSLGRLYTNALLASLNSRRNLRQATQIPSFTVMTTRVITSTTDEEYPMSPRSVKEIPPHPVAQ